jgi:hypothetical protein
MRYFLKEEMVQNFLVDERERERESPCIVPDRSSPTADVVRLNPLPTADPP